MTETSRSNEDTPAAERADRGPQSPAPCCCCLGGSSGKPGTSAARIAVMLLAVLLVAAAVAGGYWGVTMLSDSSRTVTETAAREALAEQKVLMVTEPGTKHVTSIHFQSRDLDQGQLENLAALYRIGSIHLGGTNITDDQLQYLANLDHLASLVSERHGRHRRGAQTPPEGSADLEALHLTDTAVSDAGLVHLRAIGSLTVLDLSHTKVTDKGLDQLLPLANLRWLLLSGNDVTDEGLETLTAMTGLGRLTVTGTKVTPEGVKKSSRPIPSSPWTRARKRRKKRPRRKTPEPPCRFRRLRDRAGPSGCGSRQAVWL